MVLQIDISVVIISFGELMYRQIFFFGFFVFRNSICVIIRLVMWFLIWLVRKMTRFLSRREQILKERLSREVCLMIIGISVIWRVKLFRSSLYDIFVFWIKLKKFVVSIVILWTDYQLVFVLWVRYYYILSIIIFCCYVNIERGFSYGFM